MAATTITIKTKKRWFFMPVMMLINPHLAFMDGPLFCPLWLVKIGLKTEVISNG